MTSDKLRIVVATIFLVGGIYVAYLVFVAPQRTVNLDKESQANYLQNKAPTISSDDTLIIPKISVKAPIHQGGAESLENGGIWHRQPQNGTPKEGNFVLAGHRYQFALTPNRTTENSVLYELDELQTGDIIYVDWQKKRYAYKVSKLYSVTPYAVEIENRSSTPKLTLYTCTLEGSTDGRVVIEAQPL